MIKLCGKNLLFLAKSQVRFQIRETGFWIYIRKSKWKIEFSGLLYDFQGKAAVLCRHGKLHYFSTTVFFCFGGNVTPSTTPPSSIIMYSMR